MLSDKCMWTWGHCLLFHLGQALTTWQVVIMVKREPASLTIGEACQKRTLSNRPVSREWDNRTQMVRWTSVCRCWTRNYGALVQTARVCICVLRTNRTRRQRKTFVACQWEKSPGCRELEERAKEKTWTEIGVERTERR
ncbi:hypothetical protein TNCV_43871 [Trichonephila clavipes]|nr:hypothetical protein TNCV_43871 [Trichonephila clavipes]